MSAGRRGRPSLLLVVLIFILAFEAGAKKKKKKKKKKHHSAPQPPPSAIAQPDAAAAFLQPAADLASRQQCEAEKSQLLAFTQQQSEENKQVVGKHNNLVVEFNNLLHLHSELIKKYNQLVTELEDPSVVNFLAAKAIKAYHHPGVEGAVNKTVIHVLPVAQQATINAQLIGSAWFNNTHSKVQGVLQSFGGDDNWVPAVSGWIVYGSVMIPVAIACWCVLEFVCKLDQMLLFGNVYLTMFAVSLAGFALFTGEDPLSTFAEQDDTLYQFAQCAFALMFVMFGVVSSVAWCCRENTNGWRLVHFLVLISFGVLYYILIWTPAMTDELPMVDEVLEGLSKSDDVPRLLVAAPYLVLALVFCALLLGEHYTSKDSGRDEKRNEDRSD